MENTKYSPVQSNSVSMPADSCVFVCEDSGIEQVVRGWVRLGEVGRGWARLGTVG